MADEQFIRDLYFGLLDRTPGAEELASWVATELSDVDLYYAFLRCTERAERKRVHTEFPPGHYHSPVVDPVEARKFAFRDVLRQPATLPGLKISLDRMEQFWLSNKDLLRCAHFENSPGRGPRFYYPNNTFPLSDAILYRLMILAHRPKCIIEIGSGFSTAVSLDTIDEGKLDTRIICIEPDPIRLRALMRPADRERVTVVEKLVQEVAPSTFEALEPADMLFIDSSHVLKTGSDVHYVLFDILPSLRPGVLVHFHDIDYPFEYNDEWVYQRNFSWNEIYAVRAFLMYNHQYRIDFFNDLFSAHRAEVISNTLSHLPYKDEGGSSLWLTKMLPG